MAWQVVQQPDEKLALFSTVVDDFLIYDADWAEIEEYFMEVEASSARLRFAGFKERSERKLGPEVWEDVRDAIWRVHCRDIEIDIVPKREN